MNFTQYMNTRIFDREGWTLAIGEQRDSPYPADMYVDLANADIVADLESDDRHFYGHVVRLGEVLEHLTNDASLLRRIHAHRLLVTVPYYGEAPYHVRLHNRWSITQLLSVTGWKVIEYIPRKAPRLDRMIYFLRIFGQWVNPLFFHLNAYLPMKPNGGYFLCERAAPKSMYEINREEFDVR